jgi:hypothetical protein
MKPMLEPAEQLQRDDAETANRVADALTMVGCFLLGLAVGVVGWSMWE